MKVFCFSFIVYLFLLLSQPCQDLAALVDEGRNKNLNVSAIRQPSEMTESSEECSPFCICSCCGLSVTDRSLLASVPVDREDVSISTIVSEYETPSVKTFQNSIWQPPKV